MPPGTCHKRTPQKSFYTGVERYVDQQENVFFMASPAKALANYVYVRRLTWTDIDAAIGSLRIEPDQLAAIAPEELSELEVNYSNGRV